MTAAITHICTTAHTPAIIGPNQAREFTAALGLPYAAFKVETVQWLTFCTIGQGYEGAGQAVSMGDLNCYMLVHGDAQQRVVV